MYPSVEDVEKNIDYTGFHKEYMGIHTSITLSDLNLLEADAGQLPCVANRYIRVIDKGEIIDIVSSFGYDRIITTDGSSALEKTSPTSQSQTSTGQWPIPNWVAESPHCSPSISEWFPQKIIRDFILKEENMDISSLLRTELSNCDCVVDNSRSLISKTEHILDLARANTLAVISFILKLDGKVVKVYYPTPINYEQLSAKFPNIKFEKHNLLEPRDSIIVQQPTSTGLIARPLPGASNGTFLDAWTNRLWSYGPLDSKFETSKKIIQRTENLIAVLYSCEFSNAKTIGIAKQNYDNCFRCQVELLALNAK